MISRLPRPVNAPLFMVPADFAPEEFLPASLRKRADDARWFLHTVIWKVAHGDTDQHGWARLDSRVLRRVMSKRSQPAVVRALVEGGVIEPPAPHCAGVKAKGYRPAARTLTQRCALVEAQDRRLIERIQREVQRLQAEQLARWLPIHHELAEMQRGLTILPTADLILEGLGAQAQLCQSVLVENIRRGIGRFTVSKTGRCFNWLTGLKRELRKTLRLLAEPIGGVDIACAQPALLGVLMRLATAKNVPTYIQGQGFLASCLPGGGLGLGRLLLRLNTFSPLLGGDAVRFEFAASCGDLYAALVSFCKAGCATLPDDPLEARELVKLLLLRDVFAKRGRYPSPFEDTFRAAFPTVHEFVRRVNRWDHAQLIRALQRLESWLVIENVAPLLVGRGIPIVTLHDAIYSRVADVPAVIGAFDETFEQLGVRLRVKIETSPADSPAGRKKTVGGTRKRLTEMPIHDKTHL